MAEGTSGVTGNGDVNNDDGTVMSPDAMRASLVQAAQEVAAVGLAMSIAGYEAQAASKHP